MHFLPNIGTSDLERLITQTVVIGTPTAWDKSVTVLKAEGKKNPFAPCFFAERYALEMAMYELRKYKRRNDRLPDFSKADPATRSLYAFAAMLVNVHDRLRPPAQKALAGRVRAGLKNDDGLAPLAFELLIAADLLERGADVEWHDLESGGFDFLVRRGNAVAEVECKTFSADIGRKVHRRRQYQLSDYIHSELKHALARFGTFYLDVVIEDRLVGKAVQDVATAIGQVLKSGSEMAGPAPCSIALHHIPAHELPPTLLSSGVTPQEVSHFIEQKFGRRNPSLLVMGNPDKAFAFIQVRSAMPDTVVDGMYKALKKGCEQFSGSRPAILCAHVLDLTTDELVSLHTAQESGQPSYLNRMATRLLKGNRPLLHAVKFSAPGMARTTRVTEGGVAQLHVRESGASFSFANKDQPFADDPDMRLILGPT